MTKSQIFQRWKLQKLLVEVEITFHCSPQCCLDFSRQVMKLQSVDEDGSSGEDQLPFLTPPSDSQCQHDNNENQ